jgi:hypothetical protein
VKTTGTPRSLPYLPHQETESACELSSASHFSLNGGNALAPLFKITIHIKAFEQWERATIALHQPGAGEHRHYQHKEEGDNQWVPAGVLSCLSISAEMYG